MPASNENTKDKIETCLLIAVPSSSLNYPENSLQILLRGESLANEIGDRKSLALFRRNLTHCYSVKGDIQNSFQYSERCFQDAKELHDVSLTATSARELCLFYWLYGRFFEIFQIAIPAITLLEEKEKKYQTFGTRSNTYSGLCAYCVQAHGGLGNFDEATFFYDKGIKIVNELNDKYGIAWIDFCYAVSCMLKGDGDRCIQLASDAIRKAEEGEALLIYDALWSPMGYGYVLLDQPDEALKHFEKGMKFQKETGTKISLAHLYWGLSEAYLSLGELVDAQRYANGGLKVSQENNMRHFEAFFWQLVGYTVWKNDSSQDEKAIEYVNRGIRRLIELKLKPWSSRGYLYLGEIYLNAGQKKLALEDLKIAERRFREMGSEYWLKKTQDVLGLL